MSAPEARATRRVNCNTSEICEWRDSPRSAPCCIPKRMRAAGPVVGLSELLALAKERFLSDPDQSEELKAHLREIDETVRMSAADPARKAA